MSKYKFELCTFITKNKGYWEYEDISDLIEQQGKEELKDILGYFPSNSNVTYEELDNYSNDNNWIVCYQDDKTDSHEIATFNNTLDLKFNLESLISKAYRNEYISIFNMSDMLNINN